MATYHSRSGTTTLPLRKRKRQALVTRRLPFPTPRPPPRPKVPIQRVTWTPTTTSPSMRTTKRARSNVPDPPPTFPRCRAPRQEPGAWSYRLGWTFGVFGHDTKGPIDSSKGVFQWAYCIQHARRTARVRYMVLWDMTWHDGDISRRLHGGMAYARKVQVQHRRFLMGIQYGIRHGRRWLYDVIPQGENRGNEVMDWVGHMVVLWDTAWHGMMVIYWRNFRGDISPPSALRELWI